MKNKLITTLLVLCGVGTIVGAGFSTWVFADMQPKSMQVVGSVVVSPSASIDCQLYTSVEKLTLNIDQGGAANTDVNDGIYFSNEEEALITTLDLKCEVKVNGDDSLLKLSNVTLSLNIDKTNANGLFNYVDFVTDPSFNQVENNPVLIDGVYTINKQIDLSMRYLNKPTSTMEVKTMRDELFGNGQPSFNFVIDASCQYLTEGI